VNASVALRVAAVVAALAVVVAACAVVVFAGHAPEDAAVLARVLEARLPVLLFVGGIAAAACAGAAGWFSRRFLRPAQVLAEQARTALEVNPEARIEAPGAPEYADLAAAIGRLVAERRELLQDAEARAREAGARLEEERNRLAALLSDLAEGVLVCNTEGRVLLYNEQARSLFAAGSETEAAALVGLGRSVFQLIDREEVEHALEILRRQLARGHAAPITRFVTGTPAGRLVKVRAAPYVDAGGEVAGLVFALEDVTGVLEREARHQELVQALARAAATPAEAGPLLQAALREHEAVLKSSLHLYDIRAADLLGVARQRLEPLLGVTLALEEISDDLWLRADSYALVQALGFLAGRLREDYQVRHVRLGARAAGGLAEVELAWSDALVASDALSMWELEPMRVGATQTPLTLRDVLQRHRGEVSLQRRGAGGARESAFLLRLPAGASAGSVARVAGAQAGSRPEYYDFDLFRGGPLPAALHERRLVDLAYTVFDTETTGLEPSAGDEIISIGAVRVVNSRLLRGEVYEQLVDPRRPLRPESMKIHGIPAEALQGQPGIERVLPAFRRFCEDTVLVAHNAAFDLRFLEMKEAATGVRFDAPVLDTLLLSALVHPAQGDHRLESIAERLGVSVVGRHTALGDALVTGEVFLKLLPLLAQRGIATLGQALEASRETYYARLRY